METSIKGLLGIVYIIRPFVEITIRGWGFFLGGGGGGMI